jgi:hypothetical protein
LTIVFYFLFILGFLFFLKKRGLNALYLKTTRQRQKSAIRNPDSAIREGVPAEFAEGAEHGEF